MNAYSYVVLRYVHDIGSGEFLNLGVIVRSPSGTRAFFRTSFERLVRAFPGTSDESFRTLLEPIAREAERVPGTTAMEVAKALLPRDDSALQWSPMGAGRAVDVEHTARELFERMVMRNGA